MLIREGFKINFVFIYNIYKEFVMNPERGIKPVERTELSPEVEALRLAMVEATLEAAAGRGNAEAGEAAWKAVAQ